MTIRTTTRNAAAIARAFRNSENFATSGALKGVADPYWIETGRMSREDAHALRTAQNDLGIDYIVLSYGTPIAYLIKRGEWVVPDARYSVTTSKHQHTIRCALSMIGAR